MKLPGVAGQTGSVPSLGREDPGRVVSLANQQAAAARAQASFALDAGEVLTDFADDLEDEVDRQIVNRNKREIAEAGVGLAGSMTTFTREHGAVTEYQTADVPEEIDINRDNPTAPAFEVRPHLYNRWAKEAIQEHAKRISDKREREAWIAKQEVTREENYRRRLRSSIDEAKTYNQEKAKTGASMAIQDGNFDGARLIISSSNLPNHEKGEWLQVIDRDEQLHHVNNAIASGDLEQMRLAEAMLAAENKRSMEGGETALNAEERKTKLVELRGAIKRKEDEDEAEIREETAGASARQAYAERGTKTHTEVIAEIRERDIDQAEKDATIRRYKEIVDTNRTLAAREKEDRETEVWELLTANPLMTIPMDVQGKVRTEMEKFKRLARTDTPPTTDNKTYDRLFTLMMDEPEKFADTNLLPFIASLSRGDMDYFRRNQAAIKDPGKRTQLASTDDQIKTWLRAQGVTKFTDEKGAAALNSVRTLVGNIISAREEAAGRKLKPAEIQDVLVEVFAARKVGEPAAEFWKGGPDIPFTGTSEIKYSDIPPAEAQAIVREILKQKKEPTAQAVIDIWASRQ